MKLALPIAVVAITAGVTNALGGVTLTNIPIPSWLSEVSNEARGISPDGKYVIGVSGTGPSGGYFYDVANGVVRQPSPADAPGAVPSILTGIAYRTVTNQQQIVLDGMSAGYQANWMTPDGGLTWGAKRRNTSFTQASVLPVANSLGASTESDVFYQIIRDTDMLQLFTNQGSNTWNNTIAPTLIYIAKNLPTNGIASMNAVAATGRAVGWRTVGFRSNYVLDYPPSAGFNWYFGGLDGTLAGEAFSISLDGNIIFGQSPVSGGRPGRWGYKGLVSELLGSLQSIDELRNFRDTVGVTDSAAVPYGCTSDGEYAVGMSYRGVEKAVLWDTSDPNPGKWTVLDLTDLAAANGILGIFNRLARAYGVGVNAAGELVITGYGFDASANKRAFVMALSPPISRFAYPPTLTISRSYPAGFTFSFGSATGMTNYLEYTTNITPPSSWITISSTQSTGGIIILSHTNPPAPPLFYRIRSQ